METKNTIELMPCPFCGNRNLIAVERKRKDSERMSYFIVCDYKNGGCGANGGRRSTMTDAKIVWNYRAPSMRDDGNEQVQA